MRPDRGCSALGTIALYQVLGISAVRLQVTTEAPPLCEEADGSVRVGGSRVLLELVIRAFEEGATPEVIVQRYDTLKLADVYAAITYYLRHPAEIASYLERREQLSAEVRQRIESQQGDMNQIRARLLTRDHSRG